LPKSPGATTRMISPRLTANLAGRAPHRSNRRLPHSQGVAVITRLRDELQHAPAGLAGPEPSAEPDVNHLHAGVRVERAFGLWPSSVSFCPALIRYPDA
jgi:hypothetical protein